MIDYHQAQNVMLKRRKGAMIRKRTMGFIITMFMIILMMSAAAFAEGGEGCKKSNSANENAGGKSGKDD